MKGLEGIYIVNKTDTTLLFSYDLVSTDSHQWNISLFSPFLSAFQSFASELNQKEVRRIQIADIYLYSKVNDEYNLIFVIRCGKGMKEQKALELLEKLLKACTYNFKSNGISMENLSTIPPSAYEKEIFPIIKEKSRLLSTP